MKTHGWLRRVIGSTEHTGMFIGSDDRLNHYNITGIPAYTTRKKARARKLSDEVIRKVSLDNKGNAIKIIPGR